MVTFTNNLFFLWLIERVYSVGEIMTERRTLKCFRKYGKGNDQCDIILAFVTRDF